MTRFILTLSLLPLALGLGAQTVFGIVEASEDHTTLEAAIISGGLDDDLAGEGPFTLFAPTDDAFEALPEGTLDFLLMEENADSLAFILAYHVVPDSATAADLSDGMMLPTLNEGDSLMVTLVGDSVFVNGVAVITADIEASNGVVHVIGEVLLPPADTSSTSLRQEPAFARGVSIAPNPAGGFTTVNLPPAIVGDARLFLRDLGGRVLSTQVSTSPTERLELGELPAGTYLLEIRASEGAIQRRVVVR